jgi:hypothetical protein
MMLTAIADGVAFQNRTPFIRNPQSDVVEDPDATFAYSYKSSSDGGEAPGLKLTDIASEVAILSGAQLTAAKETDPFDAASSATTFLSTVGTHTSFL